MTNQSYSRQGNFFVAELLNFMA